ncbi:MAG: 4-(cytidine 5'-diphospho)-2-C-methyl-D-erythritol kinase [Bacillota bacterium]
MVVPAHAKVNLSLDVLGRRSDGYHDIRSVMAKLCLHDRVHLYRRDTGITLDCSSQSIPSDHRNLAHRAALRFQQETGIGLGVHMVIEKHIPIAAGLAGGSADAAAVLHGLNQLWAAGLSVSELARLGASIGSDVPFCVKGTCALVTGRGELVEEIPWAPIGWVVLARPAGLAVSTSEAYAELDRRTGGQAGSFTPRVLQALSRGCPHTLAASLGNGFEEAVLTRWPGIADLKQALLDAGALGACLSGSGPVVLALASVAEQGQAIAGCLARRPGTEVWLTRFLGGGGEEEDEGRCGNTGRQV